MREEDNTRDMEDSFDMGFGENRKGLPVFYLPSIGSREMMSGVKEQNYVDMLQEQKSIREEYFGRD